MSIDHAQFVGLLASGGDGRLVLDDVGLNRYGSGFEPEPDAMQLGSCTASTISELGFAAASETADAIRGGKLSVADAYRDVRARLRAAVLPTLAPAADVLLTPSGTDAEYLPVLLALDGGRHVTNVVVAPTEVGSGTLAAAELRHFDSLTPAGDQVDTGTSVDPTLSSRVSSVRISVRDGVGRPLEPEVIDHAVDQAVEGAVAQGHDVVLHVVAHSKTGVHAPSLEYARDARRRHGARLHVVVDAAQGRVSRRGLAEVIELGFVVILTGSKFFGGPPFSGAVVIPERYRSVVADLECPTGLHPYFSAWQAPTGWRRWRASAPERDDMGTLLRWAAALAEIETYYALDDRTRFRVLRAFDSAAFAALDATEGMELENAAASILDNVEARLLQSKRTVFSFAVRDLGGRRLDTDDLRRVQAVLRRGSDRPEDPSGRCPLRVQTGQPVVVGADGEALLRIALGVPLLRHYATLPADQLESIIADEIGFVARWIRSVA